MMSVAYVSLRLVYHIKVNSSVGSATHEYMRFILSNHNALRISAFIGNDS